VQHLHLAQAAAAHRHRDEPVIDRKILDERIRPMRHEVLPGLPIRDLGLRNLDEPEVPDVDLWIRSSGEQRLSNFLLWQSAYAELVFLDTLWPDFDRRHLWHACEIYASRDRRFGGAIPNSVASQMPSIK